MWKRKSHWIIFTFSVRTVMTCKHAYSVTSLMSNSLQPCRLKLPGSSVHGILQARIVEWVAMLSSRGSSQPRNRTQVSRIAGRFFTIWATREAHQSDWTELNTVVKIANAKPCPKDRDVWFRQWATLSWKWLSLSLSPVMALGLNSGFTDWYMESSTDSFTTTILQSH